MLSRIHKECRPWVVVESWVDDLTMIARGTRKSALNDCVGASKLLKQGFDENKLSISRKTTAYATTPGMKKELVAGLAAIGIQLEASTFARD